VLREWRTALVADGGEKKIPAQQRAIIELATRTYLLLETFRAHTGRAAPLPGGYSEAVAIVDRQSGKSRIAGTLAAYEAALAGRERGV
jgi:hypothetical protein